MPTSQMTMQTVAGRAKLGAVTAIASLARSTGGAVGAALFGAVVFGMIPQAGRETLLQAAASESGKASIVRAFHAAFLFAAALAAIAAFTASRIPRMMLWDPPARR
jgi:hypothetical protein